MATYIAFLRAINVGGRFVKMSDLRAGLSHKGFGEVESYIQSGNLRFSSSLRSVAKVELRLQLTSFDRQGRAKQTGKLTFTAALRSSRYQQERYWNGDRSAAQP